MEPYMKFVSTPSTLSEYKAQSRVSKDTEITLITFAQT